MQTRKLIIILSAVAVSALVSGAAYATSSSKADSVSSSPSISTTTTVADSITSTTTVVEPISAAAADAGSVTHSRVVDAAAEPSSAPASRPQSSAGALLPSAAQAPSAAAVVDPVSPWTGPTYNGEPCLDCHGPDDFKWYRDDQGYCFKTSTDLGAEWLDQSCALDSETVKQRVDS